ncbi:potassium transporter [Amanita rubescens]|nr:potassium transporter [Amanita rubescens]
MSDLPTFDEGLRRTQVKLRGSALIFLAYQALGIIYSDIGTSPLYVLNGIWPSSGPAPSKEDVIGAISAIIWAISLLPLLKYVIISLKFGTDEGEGGTFALYQGLFPPAVEDHEADRTLTVDSSQERKGHFDTATIFSIGKRRISKSHRWTLLIWCLFGTALTMADGIFTPAVSVTSAVGGMAVAKASINKDVIPVSIAFLVVLFLLQQFGTHRIGFMFAPISFVWFLLLAGTGIYNITSYPGIFRAFDPSRAILLFVRTRNYDILAGVLLALTGCEAVFANLGQFNEASIRLSFCCVVYPSIILAYLGQGARLITDGDTVIANVFYNSIPGKTNGPLFWIVFVVAILATLVASQAMISATFSLFQQVINMKSFPPLRMICTSDQMQGQVYIPAVNWVLMILTIIVVAVFSNLQNLTNAYGFSVSSVMFSTSILLGISMYYVKHLHWIFAVGFVCIFGFFDGLFWVAALKKVPHGAWVPLMIGIILVLSMLLWTWGKALEDRFDRANRKNLRHFIQENNHTSDSLSTINKEIEAGDVGNGVDIGDAGTTEGEANNSVVLDPDADTVNRVRGLQYVSHVSYRLGDQGNVNMVAEEKRDLQRITTCAVFHKFTHGPGVPHTFVGFIRQWPALPRVVIFLSVVVVPLAHISDEDRYVVRKVRSLDGIYGVTYYLGFREEFHVDADRLADRICASEIIANPNTDKAWLDEIKTLVGAATHIVPHYHIVSKKVEVRFMSPVVNFVRRWLLEDVYRRLATMFPQTANWLTSADEIIRVGINASI